MPDVSGQLSQGEKERIVVWLKGQWSQDDRCPVSGGTNWIILDHLVHPPPYANAGRGMNLGGPKYPQVMVACKDCGYTMYFNAVLIGIASEEKQEADVHR